VRRQRWRRSTVLGGTRAGVAGGGVIPGKVFQVAGKVVRGGRYPDRPRQQAAGRCCGRRCAASGRRRSVPGKRCKVQSYV